MAYGHRFYCTAHRYSGCGRSTDSCGCSGNTSTLASPYVMKESQRCSMGKRLSGKLGNWPTYGWVGLGLMLSSWIVNWSVSGLRTHVVFFPLWLGYCLIVDAFTARRKNTSMVRRDLAAYVRLFLISALVWWVFEIVNWRTNNWRYLGRQELSQIQYFVFASLSFSTVMPAIFGTAELISSFRFARNIRGGFRVPTSRMALRGFFGVGCLMLVLTMVWPKFFYPFVWISLYFILEPINVWRGHRTLAAEVSMGDWRSVFSLWIGALVCGFLWEMWNFFSLPKWVYMVPFVDFLRVFEMPILGYGGYIPFSLELFAFYHLIVGLFWPKDQGLVEIGMCQ